MANERTDSKNMITIVTYSSDAAAGQAAVSWAVGHLEETCRQQGIGVSSVQRSAAEDVREPGICVLVADVGCRPLAALLQTNGVHVPVEPESFSLFWHRAEGQQLLAAAGRDARGLVYAVLELADCIKYSPNPLADLAKIDLRSEKPASPVRGVNRLFVSEAEDKPWFYDHSFWNEYLTELATHRFNRLHLALGMGYDYGHDPGVQDNYFCFAYPYFVSVNGYDVRVTGLPEGEARKNLDMLRYISAEAKRRAIHFQLGIWTHAYDPSESPNASYVIEGVHQGNHAAYCRDALRTLLEQCPAIDGVTIRTHYEGGIPEPAHDFWREVFQGVTECGRQVEIDLHSKGVDDQMLQVALDTGMPIVVSPKYWAEHMGPPYHQAAIRPSELPVDNTERPDLMAITATYRRFTRYGYADFLKEDRKFGVLFRIWPGTQRLLLWGDPAMAAGYGRMGDFCGAVGTELCEPLTFKARKGSGSPGGRDPYADESLRLQGKEWRKYLYSYRLWGRLLYNPDSDPGSWRRYLEAEFGAGAGAIGEALANASRILPLVTAAHLPSAANNHFWPEMYTNMSIVNKDERSPYGDTPEPKTFGAVSPLDPALFYRIDDFAEDLVRGKRNGKYSPLDVAEQLIKMAEAAERLLAEATSKITAAAASPSFRRFSIDVAAQAGLGHFFARKFRAGVAYALFERTGDTVLLEFAIRQYREAKEAWTRVIESTRGSYRDDITFGYVPHMRGHWSDRLAAIEEDIAAMERKLEAVGEAGSAASRETASANAFLQQKAVQRPSYDHISPELFRKGQPIDIAVSFPADVTNLHVMLLYRHANQVENYRQTVMTKEGNRYETCIPESCTDTSYPIVYFFELRDDAGNVWMAPGFNETFSNQPYYIVRQR